MSKGGNWMAGNQMCKVELGEVLSDHKPIVLEGGLEGEVSWKLGYFKINTSLINMKEGEEIIEEAFQPNIS
eukprot:c4400_g1_i1 orf=55-267(+)